MKVNVKNILMTMACISFFSAIQCMEGEGCHFEIGVPYKIINKQSGFVLNFYDAHKAKSPGIVNAYPDDGKVSQYDDHKLFYLAPQGNGWYSIVSKSNGLKLNISANTNRYPIKVFAGFRYKNYISEMFDEGTYFALVKYNDEGWYKIKHKITGCLINIHNAHKEGFPKNVNAYPDDGNWIDHRLFKFIPQK